MFKQMVTAKTASGDTTKTLIDTVTVPDGVTELVGLASVVAGGPGATTLENVSGYIELESDDVSIVPAQFLTDVVVCLTSGTAGWSPKQWPCSIKVKPSNRIKVYVTMDMALTVAYTCRVQLTFN